MGTFYILFILTIAMLVNAVPLESVDKVIHDDVATVVENSTLDSPATDNSLIPVSVGNKDSDTAPSEDKAATDYEDNIDSTAEASDNQNGDGSIYDAFQQYINRYGAGAYAPYPAYPAAYPAPLNQAAYPAPINYGAVPVPAVYPSPYAVQTAYEGYLVPSTTASTTTTSTTTAASTTSSITLSSLLSLLNPINFFTNILPTIMMSTVFRAVAAVVSAIGMILFSGAISNAICNFTPLCDITFRSANYLTRFGRSENIGRMITEEITPERLSQADEFIRGAIRKYRDLQKAITVVDNKK